MNNIKKVLKNIFEQHRIVLWYGGEATAEMRQRFEEVQLDSVEKIEVLNNPFATKYRLLKQQPQQSFLVFIPGEQPADRDNWLLDIGLDNHIFSTDEVAIFLQELELEQDFRELLREHLAFFRNQERRQSLNKQLVPQEETARSIRWKMLGVLAKTEANLEAILMSMINAMAKGEDATYPSIVQYGLDDFWWKAMEQHYDYNGKARTIQDFVEQVFQTAGSAFRPRTKPLLNRGALVLLHRWQDSTQSSSSFEYFSQYFAEQWEAARWLAVLHIEDLEDADVYEAIDQKILKDLRHRMQQKTLRVPPTLALLEKRSRKYWYSRYRHHYEAFGHAIDFFELLRTLDFNFSTADEALQRYQSHYYKIDQIYRQYYQSYHLSNQDSLLSELSERIEKAYSNRFLLPLNDHWQEELDSARLLHLIGTQRQFWTTRVLPYYKQKKRIFVIISDALRYESGAELRDRLLTIDRFEAQLFGLTAAVPTYTQLGMAALLPHRQLALDDKANIWADGKSTQGTSNRDKILKAATKDKAVALTAEEFFRKTSSRLAGREWVKAFQVIYIYSDTIDKSGEGETNKLFQRTEEEFERIIQLLKKIAAINGTNVFITSDHGYLYQYQPLATSDYADYQVEGKTTSKKNRRVVIGKQLEVPKGSMHFSSEELGLQTGWEVAIPKSVHRMRRSGSDSRYVHGGLSLQELVLPLIVFSKKRSSRDDTKKVRVDYIRSLSRITAHQQVLSFYQENRVEGKTLPRTLRLGFYDQQGNSISDTTTVIFDSPAKEERQRETKITFTFSQAAQELYQKEVYLRLEETNGALYREFPFTMMIMTGGDFDDFGY